MFAPLIGALGIGLTLGLLGSGGSILTVPVLTYLVGQDEKVAIAGSLAIVGIISAVAVLSQLGKGRIHWRSVLWFGIPGMAGTYLGAWLGGFVPGALQLLVFSGLMALAAWRMLRPVKTEPGTTADRSTWKIVLDGLAVGALTGFVGVGGGFLIVPALVLLGGLSMPVAVATSLVIIVMKSASGFYKYQQVLEVQQLSLDWQIIGLISALGIVGSLLGTRVKDSLPQDRLQQIFAILLLGMTAYMLWQLLPQVLTWI